MLNVGLTGGIASGKTAVAGIFKEKGARLIDFDVLARQAEEPGQPAWKAIVDYFGGEILNGDGTINRESLGSIVFRNGEKLNKLNGIVHPILFQEWRRRLAHIKETSPRAIVISDIPLLIETGMQNIVDVVVLVYATPAQQIERLVLRNGCTREEAVEKLASQLPIDEKVSRAHIVIYNSSQWEATMIRAEEVWGELMERAACI